MDFYSRILHSLSPDENGFWITKDRLNVEIRGWPKIIKWFRTADLEFKGELLKKDAFQLTTYLPELLNAISNISSGAILPTRAKVYSFEIGKENNWKQYLFLSKARTIAALCVLYDLKPHPRNELELNIPRNLGLQAWPFDPTTTSMVRTYGDPSKTADVLRNEGWPRTGTKPGLKVFQQNFRGSRQQMYQLLQTEQVLADRKMRSVISKKWRQELFKCQNYTCQICHNRYPEEYLDPDHRIPVIVVADELNEQNYKSKLMTLCRFCNQAKREACKKLPHDYDWSKSPWAYPEKFEIKKIREELKRYAKTHGLSIPQVFKLIKD
ncbi:MAG: HNH endonuclease signature motif containing protein [Candidatus Omnitrophota bacterium]